jgi:hypothetical protein
VKCNTFPDYYTLIFYEMNAYMDGGLGGRLGGDSPSCAGTFPAARGLSQLRGDSPSCAETRHAARGLAPLRGDSLLRGDSPCSVGTCSAPRGIAPLRGDSPHCAGTRPALWGLALLCGDPQPYPTPNPRCFPRSGRRCVFQGFSTIFLL